MHRRKESNGSPMLWLFWIQDRFLTQESDLLITPIFCLSKLQILEPSAIMKRYISPIMQSLLKRKIYKSLVSWIEDFIKIQFKNPESELFRQSQTSITVFFHKTLAQWKIRFMKEFNSLEIHGAKDFRAFCILQQEPTWLICFCQKPPRNRTFINPFDSIQI